MKRYFLVLGVAGFLSQGVLGQHFDRSLLLDEKADTSANISFGDLDGDGHLDIMLAKGRHWPIVDKVLLGDGKGGILRRYDLGKVADRSFSGGLADFNGDGWPDIIVANRGGPGSANYVCLNRGKGKFDANCIPFAHYPATTISPADINHDGFVDLVVPNRDSGQSYVYLGGSDRTFLDARRIPFGPADARIRMAVVADLNGDGFPAGFSIAGPTVVPYALAVADLNKDGKMDIIVGHVEAPSSVFFNDGTGRHYTVVPFGDSKGTVYGFAVGDFDEDGKLDIGAARSDAPSVLYFGDYDE
jgi:hypothetical protein